jgi:hypothetical protein
VASIGKEAKEPLVSGRLARVDRLLGSSTHRAIGPSGGRVGLTGHRVIKLSGCWVGLSLTGLWSGYQVLSHRFGVPLSGCYVSGRAQVLGLLAMGWAVMYRVAVVIGLLVLSLAGFLLSGRRASGCGQLSGYRVSGHQSDGLSGCRVVGLAVLCA